MKTFSFTKNFSPMLVALGLLIAGLLSAGKAEASCKASFTDTVKGETVYFYSTSTAASSTYAISWSFGDGHSSSGSKDPVHPYSAYATSYTVCLVIDDTINKCIDTVCKTVTTGAAPCSASASFKFSNGSGGSVSFSNTSTSSSGHYLCSWDFNDKTSSTSQSPSHTFKANGVYHVCLTITDSANHSCTSTYCVYDTVKNATSCYAYYAYSLSGGLLRTSNGSVTKNSFTSSWSWGDGSPGSSATSPTHTYAKNGTYDACLTVTDSIAGCSATYCDTIRVTSACSAHFSYAASKLTAGFTDSGSSALTAKHSASWNFGDGSSAGSGDYTTHTYSKSGTYTVCVTVYDSATKCASQYCANVTVSNCALTVSIADTISGHTVKFDGGTSGISPHSSVKWYFGDGTEDSTSGLKTTHTYSSSVTSETVYLYVYDSTTNCSAYAVETITFCTAKSDFTDNISGYTVSFASDSSNKPTVKYSWTFGDKGTSDNKRPSHTYSGNGTYSVCLTATDSVSKCSTTTCANITINNCTLTASFTDTISGHAVKFYGKTNASSYSKITWIFGDGTTDSTSGLNVSHTYGSSVSSENVYMRVYDSTTKCLVYANATITFNCTASPSFIHKASGLSVAFSSDSANAKTVVYSWNFGDKSSPSTSKNPTHTFSANGTYDVCLTATDTSSKCNATTCEDITVSNCSLTVSFTDSVSGHTVKFVGTTNASSHSKITWIFGDGATDSISGLNATHTYATTITTESVYLRVYDSTTKCLAYGTATITLQSCSLSASFTDSVSGHTVVFSGTTNASSHSKITWIFGDGTTDSTSGLDTRHTYSNSLSSENVYMRVYDSTTGCLTYGTGAVTFCFALSDYTYTVSGLSVSFKADKSNGSSAKYQWDFNDKSSAGTTGDPTHTYSTGGTYNVCLTVTDSGCSTTTCHSITVTGCTLTASFKDSINKQKVVFSGKTNASSHSSITWYFGDGTSDSTSGLSVTHTYAGSVSTANVYMKVYDSTTKCLAYANATVTLSYCITGTVTTGKVAGYPARVYLITFDATDSTLTATDSTFTNSSGQYEFCGLYNGTYYTKAALTDSNSYYSKFIPTYHNDATKWATAVKIVINNAGDSNENIAMKLGTNPGGAGFIGGKISAGAGKTGDPEANILVVLYDSSGNPVTYTYSNASGYYSFAGIAFGTYDVYAEVLNKICYPAVVTITDTSTTVNDADLLVKSTTITAAIKPVGAWGVEKADIYPNPVTDKLTLSISLINASQVNLKIYDVTGKVVSELNTSLSGGAQKMDIDASSLPAGLYFLRMEMLKDNTLMEAQFVKAR